MNNQTQEIIDFTQQLVRTPSQNAVDSEYEIAHLVLKKLSQFGFEPKIIGSKNHPSVICQIKKGRGKTVWLESCLDTVPAGDLAKWDYPPFEGKVIGNKMYGRGSADAKIAIALFSYLVKSLSQNKNFSGSLFLGFDADEQSGNFTGIREIIKHAPHADICLLGYQGIEEISIGARGFLRLRLTTLGKAAHTGSRTRKGVNAIHQMVMAIEEIKKIPFSQKTEKFFEFGSNFNVAQIGGGIAINIVPDKCEALIDIRLVPSHSPQKVLQDITKALKSIGQEDENFQYRLETLQSEPAFLTDPNHPFVQILQKKADQVLKKKTPLVASGQGSVGNLISQKGIPLINAFGCESNNVHAPNEWVNLDSIPKIFKIYQESLITYCR